MENVITAFEQIYQLTYDKVSFYVLTKCGTIPEVEDILQETYSELFKVLADKGAAYIAVPEGFVMQLAKSKVYRHYSEKEKQRACAYIENVEVADAENTKETASDTVSENWEDALIDKLTAEEVMAYLAEKDELTREIFYQHYFQDKTLKEIAESCGMKETTVKKRLYRTLQELRGMKRFAVIILILLMAALLAKPVYTLAEDVISQIKRFFSKETTGNMIIYGEMYRKYRVLIEQGELPEDIQITIDGNDYTFKQLEKIWVENPWLEELDWDNTELQEGEVDEDTTHYYFEITP